MSINHEKREKQCKPSENFPNIFTVFPFLSQALFAVILEKSPEELTFGLWSLTLK